MSTKAEHLLPLCYEIEGLICLIGQRNSDVPDGIFQMIEDKLHRLSEQIETLRPAQAVEPTPEEIPISETLPDNMPEESKADDEAIANSALIEEEDDANPTAETEPVVETPEVQNREATSSLRDQLIEETAKQKFKVNYFSVNDRFRFSRELFDGNECDMEETLGVISDLTSAEEVVDYLTNDLCWDAENPTVKDFITIVVSRKQQ